jgi:hypothetical protein
VVNPANDLAINGCSDLLALVMTMKVCLGLKIAIVDMLVGTLIDGRVACLLDGFGA